MNTFQLECFLAVANALSFARAAEQMNVSQPAVTHQIKSLEDELDVRLLNRSTRLVELTEDGKTFLTDAKSILSIAEQAKTRLSSTSGKSVAAISIGCGNHAQLAMLSDVLSKLKEDFPNLHPRLTVAQAEHLFQAMETERLDLIFGVYNQSAIKGDMKFKELLESRVVCACRVDHTFTDKEEIALSDLQNEPLIFCDPMSLAPEMAKLQFQLLEGRNTSEVHFCSSSVESYILARSGFGISLLPELLIPRDPEIVKIPLSDAPKLSFGLYRKTSMENDIIRKFITYSKEIFLSVN